MPEKECIGKRAVVFNTYALTVCALLTALSVILARLLTIIPSEISRFSLEAVPILLAGLLFGPVPGAAVGFAADFIGCLFSPFGYNPIFCLPPILYGLWAGLLRGYAWTKPTVWRVALAVFPAALCGSVLWQSAALVWSTAARPSWPSSSPVWPPAASSSPSPASSTPPRYGCCSAGTPSPLCCTA